MYTDHRQRLEAYQLQVFKYHFWPIIGWPLNYADLGLTLNKYTNTDLSETSVAVGKKTTELVQASLQTKPATEPPCGVGEGRNPELLQYSILSVLC